MRIRPTFLLCGAVLIAAVPTWADRIDSIEKHPVTKSSEKSTSAPRQIERFEFGTRDSMAPLVLEAFFPSTFSMDIHPSGLREPDLREPSLVTSRVKKKGHGEREDDRGNATLTIEGSINTTSLPVSEPGAASFLLVGVVSVGFWARRHRGPQRQY